ncbi:Transmembrane protein, partial [Globisporangium splendens]
MSFRGLKSPQNDLLVPLNVHDGGARRGSVAGGSDLQSPMAMRVRKMTFGSEDLGEKNAKMNIDMGNHRKGFLKQERFAPEFLFNAEMSIRVAVGVLIASAIQTRDSNYEPNNEDSKKWFLFPDWYYLGGLSYCAVAVIFSAQKNVGATIQQVCQAFYGVGMALVYNMILFAVVNVRTSDPNSEDPYDGFYKITKTFSSSAYWVNAHNFYVILPFIMLFTVVILLLPLENSTKKFALGNNLYFALTIINPANPLDGTKLKTTGDSSFETANILRNLELYFLVGFLGTLISLFIMFIPYPVFAINRLRSETRKASEDILDLLNIIVDSYCFKNKNVDHMNFLKLKLRRKFDAANARHQRMNKLLDDVWWEQLLGFHYYLKFNRSVMKNYVRLIGSLIADLRSLNSAMQLEKYEHLHLEYMKVLQREIYIIQMRSGDLLNEISEEVHMSSKHLELKSIKTLETQMESTLHRYRSTHKRTLRKKSTTAKDVEGNVPLNLFLFSLNSFCSTLIEFQAIHNEKEHADGIRARSFIMKSIKGFFVCHHYTRLKLLSAFKVTVAILMGTFLAVYVYAYSATTPSAVAYVMGNHIGGSFSVTVNRVAGVVAGSVVPSVFQFFISQVCNPKYMNVVLSDLALFIWVAVSMYVNFSGGYGAYAGLVSAFIAAGILLKQSDVCLAGGTDSSASIAISSYSSLAQTSVGIILFILVELALCPESATSLLRNNIQETLKELQKSFEVLFGHHLSSSDVIDEDTMDELRHILQVKVPVLLVEQRKLLQEANAEPMMWRPAFSYQKYEAVLDNSHRLLNNNNLLFKLVRWFNFRVDNDKVDLKNTVDIRDGGKADQANDINGENVFRQWASASHQFQSSVTDAFMTLQMLFSDGFLYSDPEQTAIFMQMKEAFRLADKDCSGEIDADEVSVMLESIFAQSGAVKEDEIQKYVAEFMDIVDKDCSGKVSFEEFMDALENGLKLEVEVYQTHRPKAPVLRRQGSVAAGRNSISGALPRINEEDTRGSSDRLTPQGERASLSVNVTTALTPKNISSLMRRASTGTTFGGPFSPMRRQHDVLNVEDFSLSDIANSMKAAYVAWLMEQSRFEKVSMEELLLLNCLVSGAEGIARNLTTMEEIVVSS